MSENDDIYIDWYKNGNQIQSYDKRVRITNSGILKIKNSVTEDTGNFLCTAVNGFGSVKFLFTITVLDENYSDIALNEYLTRSSSDLDHSKTTEFSDKSHQLSNTFKEVPKVIISKTGSDLKLKCITNGSPKLLSVKWFNNNNEMTAHGDNSLIMKNLNSEDSANYTCQTTNQFGVTITNRFILKVIDQPIDKPYIEGNDPRNTSAPIGADVTLVCSVRSDAAPNIEWLKSMNSISDFGEENFQYTNFKGEDYRMLTNEVVQTSDNSYISNLIITKVNELDAGKYVCLAGNEQGSNYRNAFVTVYYPVQVNQVNGMMKEETALPVPIVVAFVSVFVIILLALVVWMSTCLCQQTDRPTQVPESVYDMPAKHSRYISSNASLSYNQMVVNNNRSCMPSSELRASSPLYTEIQSTTPEKPLTNVYQMYTNLKDVKTHNKPYGYLC
ncbi:fibroblast growth factor receptor-like 1 [Oppia nitens]|uniref:fibroblast growth factor receptor-like 1 n=1 Tax=Oppia nitens TaxID=1686743 RepID=UPI0023D9CCB8|nr:fibroblast growth factor receptor-like 1 [Oppia nitens]